MRPRAVQRPRRVFTAEQKATILRRHLGDKVPVSDLCDEYTLAPSLFYLWQKQALAHLTAALHDGRTGRGKSQTASADRARIAVLDATIAKKDRVLAEVSERISRHEQRVWGLMLQQLGIVRTNYARWTTAHGAVPAPHGSVPRKQWGTRAERDGILLLHAQPPLDGYRALAYLMLDAAGTFYDVVCHSRWVVAVFRALGNARVDDDPRRLDHGTAGAGTLSQHAAARDLRQQAAVYRARLSGVHPRCGHDARPHRAVLSAVERQTRTLESNAESHHHSPGGADLARRRATARHRVCHALQRRALT